MVASSHERRFRSLGEYSCFSCGRRFTVPMLGDFSYGIFIMFSATPGQMAWLEALTDKVFDEVAAILHGFPDFASIDELTQTDVLHALFSLACDPDPHGRPYFLSTACSRCGGFDVKFRGELEQPELFEVSIPDVTHGAWLALDPSARILRLRQGLDTYLVHRPPRRRR